MTIGGRSRVATRTNRQPIGSRNPLVATVAGCSEDFSGDLSGWTEFSDSGNTPAIVAGGLSADDDGFGFGFGALRHDCDIGSTDLYVECTVTAVGSDPIDENDNVTLYGRMSGVGTPDTSTLTAYGAHFGFSPGFAQVQLQRSSAGSVSNMVSITLGSDVIVGDVLRLELSGTSIRALRNGVQEASTTDGAISTGQYGGVKVDYNSPGGPTNHALVIDDYSSGPL